MTSEAGLQAERTTLAWVRTALALAATSTLLVRAGVSHGHGLIVAVAVAAFPLAAAILVFGSRRRRVHHSADPGRLPSQVTLALACLVTLLAVATATALVLTADRA